MIMTTIEALETKLRALPPHLLGEVEDFVEFLLQKRQHHAGAQSALDILAAAPGGQAFKTADEVRTYLAGERDSWDR
jgi:hypothetical protein